jgi:hypothetical protein
MTTAGWLISCNGSKLLEGWKDRRMEGRKCEGRKGREGGRKG